MDKLVREIAETLAEIHHNRKTYLETGYLFSEYDQHSQNLMSMDFSGEARAMVEKMFHIAVDAYVYGKSSGYDTPTNFQEWAAEQGLIPSPTKTGE